MLLAVLILEKRHPCWPLQEFPSFPTAHNFFPRRMPLRQTIPVRLQTREERQVNNHALRRYALARVLPIPPRHHSGQPRGMRADSSMAWHGMASAIRRSSAAQHSTARSRKTCPTAVLLRDPAAASSQQGPGLPWAFPGPSPRVRRAVNNVPAVVVYLRRLHLNK